MAVQVNYALALHERRHPLSRQQLVKMLSYSQIRPHLKVQSGCRPRNELVIGDTVGEKLT